MSKFISLLPKIELNQTFSSWCDSIASYLLNHTHLLVGGDVYRLVEIEFYYYNQEHPDPFTHRDSLQLTCGGWYFHRQGNRYRSGSFKGIDLTFGDGETFGGILIRSIAAPDNTIIDGLSLCVDRLLAEIGFPTVAQLDEAISGKLAWDTTSHIFLEETDTLTEKQIFQSARVGLSLKRANIFPDMPDYIIRPYRYLTEPKLIRKGKLYLVLALHIQGLNPTEIHQITNCPKQTIENYIIEFDKGRNNNNLTPYIGMELKPIDLCKLHGIYFGNTRINQ